jgi:DUF1680 family protein
MEIRHEPLLLGGAEVIECPALRRSQTAWHDALYASELPVQEPARIRAVPYHLWGNRGPGEMQVWIQE